jgi:hypothetical protein
MCTADPLKNRLFLATVTMPQQPVFRGAPGVEPGHSIRAHRTSAIASYRPEAGIPLGQTRTRRFHNHPYASGRFGSTELTYAPPEWPNDHFAPIIIVTRIMLVTLKLPPFE